MAKINYVIRKASYRHINCSYFDRGYFNRRIKTYTK